MSLIADGILLARKRHNAQIDAELARLPRFGGGGFSVDPVAGAEERRSRLRYW